MPTLPTNPHYIGDSGHVNDHNTIVTALASAAYLSSGNITNQSGSTTYRFGKVLQVIAATYNTQAQNDTNTFADTGLTATITPTLSTSKILVIVNQAGCYKETNNTYMELKLVRNSTDLISIEKYGGFTNSTASVAFGSCSSIYLDSPATTSATTYKTAFKSVNNNKGVFVQTNSSTSTIALVEIAA